MGLFGTKRDETQGADAPTSQIRTSEGGATARRVGIDHAIELLRSLPTENIDLVVRVLKTTLESLGVRVADIVTDAVQRQNDLQARIGELKSEIVLLEKEIERRAHEVVGLEAARTETTMVRDHLERKV